MKTIKDLSTNKNFWLIILNVEICPKQDISNLIRNAHKIVFTDGAVNVYKEYYEKVSGVGLERGPDFVIGDMDSMDSKSLEWLNDKFGKDSYETQEIIEQITTDFEKAVILIKSFDSEAEIIALNCFGGRLDHSLSILNVAEKYKSIDFQLLNEKCLAIIIKEAEVKLEFDFIAGKSCGILPLFGPIRVETKGLKWNLTLANELNFGHLISTSNKIVSDSVFIHNYTDIPYFWTHEISWE